MILVDTSVWVDHLRTGDRLLAELLEAGEVLAHPYVIGELSLGSLHNRDVFLGLLRTIPRTSLASDDEVWRFIDDHALYGRGIGYVDVHLLASVCLTPEAELWTRDKRLRATAGTFGLAFAEAGA